MSDIRFSSCTGMHIHGCKMTLALRKQERFFSCKYTCSCHSGCLQLEMTIDGVCASEKHSLLLYSGNKIARLKCTENIYNLRTIKSIQFIESF